MVKTVYILEEWEEPAEQRSEEGGNGYVVGVVTNKNTATEWYLKNKTYRDYYEMTLNEID